MKAYYIDAGMHYLVVETIEELGSIRDDVWLGNVVYAETAAKAKHLFIEWNNSHNHAYLEYTDKMSIRVLAHEGDEKWQPHITDAYEYEEMDWMRGRLTGFGYERHEQFLKDSELF